MQASNGWLPPIVLCHDMEKLSALLALCEGNPPGIQFPYKWPVMWSFDMFFVVSLLNQGSSWDSRLY